MFIHYKLYRSKNNEVFDEGKLQFNITEQTHLITLDDIITKVIADYINSTDYVKRFGIAYVGNVELMLLEITNDDTIDMDNQTLLDYLHTEFPKWNINITRKDNSI